MKRHPPLTASADLKQEIPGTDAARSDRIQIALATLRQEQARLERLGFERPLARCRESLRYWQFLEAVFSAASSDREVGLGGRASRGRAR